MGGIPYEFMKEIREEEIHGGIPYEFMGEIHEGKFHTTTSGHYKKSNFVLAKSLVLLHGQVSKTLRSISHWLVSLLAPIFARW